MNDGSLEDCPSQPPPPAVPADIEPVAAKELVGVSKRILAGCREAMVMAASTLLPVLAPVMEAPVEPLGPAPRMRMLIESPAAGAGRPSLTSGVRARSGPASGMRMVPSVPLSLVIGDRRMALMTPAAADGPWLLVRTPGYVRAMAAVFEWIWNLAQDREPPPLGRRRAAVLVGLADGLTDAAVASRLKLTERTVRREVSAMMRELGVVSRFQLGVRAQLLGWLAEAPLQDRDQP